MCLRGVRSISFLWLLHFSVSRQVRPVAERKGRAWSSSSPRRPIPRPATSKAAPKWEKSNFYNPCTPPTNVFRTSDLGLRGGELPWCQGRIPASPRGGRSYRKRPEAGTYPPTPPPWALELPPLPPVTVDASPSFLQQIFIEGQLGAGTVPGARNSQRRGNLTVGAMGKSSEARG